MAFLRHMPFFSHTSEQAAVEEATNIFILPFFLTSTYGQTYFFNKNIYKKNKQIFAGFY
jgi:hypothetical protein